MRVMLYASAFLFPILMLFAAWMDLFTMRIANWISIVLTLLFLPVGLASGLGFGLIGQHYLCGLLVLAPTFALFAFGKIGGGDAKLAASSAIWMGWGGLFDYLIVSSLLGGVLATVVLTARQVPLPLFLLRWSWVVRLHEPKTGIPFGVALGAGAIIVYPQTPIWMGAVGA
jgi:prepilin peptidase CpaA